MDRRRLLPIPPAQKAPRASVVANATMPADDGSAPVVAGPVLPQRPTAAVEPRNEVTLTSMLSADVLGEDNEVKFPELDDDEGFSSCESSDDEDYESSKFARFDLPPWVLSRLTKLGYVEPTIVQEEAIAAIMEGEDCLIQAETGSGKTLAYALPMLAAIDPSRRCTQAVVIVPTRELGMQVSRILRQLVAVRRGKQHADPIRIMSALDGAKLRRQRAWALSDPPHIVVANPDALLYLVATRALRDRHVAMVVIDEFDACLDYGGSATGGATDGAASTADALRKLLTKHLNGQRARRPSDGGREGGIKGSRAWRGGAANRVAASRATGAAVASANGTSLDRGHRDAVDRPPRQTVFASATVPQVSHFLRLARQEKWSVRNRLHHVRPSKTGITRSQHERGAAAAQSSPNMGSKSKRSRDVVRGLPQLPTNLKHCAAVTRASSEAVVLRALSTVLQEEAESTLQRFRQGFEVDGESRRSGVRPVGIDRGKGRAFAAIVFVNNKSWGRAPEAVCRAIDPLKTTLEGVDIPWNLAPEVLDERDDLDSRGAAMDRFREGHCNVLVATDVAARGLDVPDVTHIINLDIPSTPEAYVHRAGRAGRAGKPGVVITLVPEKERFAMRRLANALALPPLKRWRKGAGRDEVSRNK